VPERVLKTITEIVERPMPVHPSLGRYYAAGYINENSRYPVDDIRDLTFAEYIRDYVYFASGTFDTRHGLVNDPTVPRIDKTATVIADDSADDVAPQPEEIDLMATDNTGIDHPDSPEYIAYRLFLHISAIERRPLDWSGDQSLSRPDRNWILCTYAQCLDAVRNPGSRTGGRNT
jgi:hypothetical protein